MIKVGSLVWFLKSMRMCEVMEIHDDGYTVETIDARNRLFATKDGIELVDGEQYNTGKENG